jgi:hypothetical protein
MPVATYREFMANVLLVGIPKAKKPSLRFHNVHWLETNEQPRALRVKTQH